MGKQYKVKKNLVIQKSDNTVSIFHGEKSLLFSLNETAAFIFLQIKKGRDINTIVTKYEETFDITRSKAQQDVDAIIETLVKKGVIDSV